MSTSTTQWPTPISTLDVAAGDIVTEWPGGKGLSVQVTDVREPTHPAMPGLVIVGHAYIKGMMRWSDRETYLHDTDGSRKWSRMPTDWYPLADERHEQGAHHEVWEHDGKLYVHQILEQISPITWRYPLSYQKCDATARKFMPGARLISDTEYGENISAKWRRIYAVPA